MVTPGDVHIDTALSEIATGYMNTGYIADKVFPIVTVKKQSDKYFTWTKDHWFRRHVQRRAPRSEVPTAGPELSNSPYYCDVFHLGADWGMEEAANQDEAVELEQTYSEWLADQFLLNREYEFILTAFTTSVWDTDVVGTTDFVKWNDLINSTPIQDIRTGKQTIQKSTGQLFTHGVMGQEVVDELAEHPALVEKYKYTSASILDDAEIARALRIPTLLVGSAIGASSVEGATFAGGYLWGDHVLLAHVAPRPGRRVPSAGYTFTWPVFDPGLEVSIRKVVDEMKMRTVLQGFNSFDHAITGTDLGYFFSDTL